MIFAQHGSRRAPHVFFDVLEEERYSETLDRHFSHRVLRIGYNYKGLTEVGGLVVRPELRGHPDAARPPAVVRALPVPGAPPQLFRDEVLSELMPPLEADGTSLLWESLGRRFTGLTYQEADRLSQVNKEFIRTLFPQDPIYATLLPPHVQELIGEVGPETKGVEKMLRRDRASATRTGSIRSTAGRTFTRAPTTSRWSGRRGRRGWPTRRRRRRAAPATLPTFLVARERPSRPAFSPRACGSPPPSSEAETGEERRCALPAETCRALDVVSGRRGRRRSRLA